MIPYQLVSMAAILRDWLSEEDLKYKNHEHEYLTGIADYFYNVGEDPERLLPEYKKLYDEYGPDYFAKVIRDMEALDGQVTSDRKAQELIDDYFDRLDTDIEGSTTVEATEDYSYAHNLVKISWKDAKSVLSNLNRSHKTVGMGGAGDPGYYVSEFEEATPGYMWASDTGLQILDDAGIPYTRIEKYKIESSKKIKASDNPFYDKLSESSKRFVRNTEKKMASMFSPDTFDVYNALLPYIGDYESNTGWSGSCDLMKVKDSTSADGYIYKVIWDNSSTEIDIFSWHINDNPRVGGDYTLMVMPAHGIPDFCDSEQDFYRAVRKIFGDGLKKIDN